MKCILQMLQLDRLELKLIGLLSEAAAQQLGDKIFLQDFNLIAPFSRLVIFSLFVLFESFDDLLVLCYLTLGKFNY